MPAHANRRASKLPWYQVIQDLGSGLNRDRLYRGKITKTHSGEFCGGNAAISAKAADFAIFARPAAQPLLLRQRLR
jgi:hypothetical protein